MSFYIQKELAIPFERAVERVKEELQKEGFGVLTEIDVQDTLKKKISVVENDRLTGIATQVKEKLQNVIAAL